jgi:hypothetical protein
VALSVAELFGTVELKDKFTPGLDKLENSVVSVSATIGVAVAAVVGLTAAIIKLGDRGAVVGDVERNFDSLTQSINGTADAMINALRRGTVGAVTDFNLMVSANKAIGAGFKGTAADMEVLAAGSRELAKRVGGDTMQAFDQLSMAMAKGRTSGLASLGIFVDQKGALESFASSIGKTSDKLSGLERQTALQNAVMGKLKEALGAAGTQGADFGEKLAAIGVRAQNFIDRLSVLVNDSKVLNAGLDELGKIIDEVFGPNQTTALQLLIKGIENFAIILAKAGIVGIEVARTITQAWNALDVMFNQLAAEMATVLFKLGFELLKFVNLGSSLPIVGKDFQAIGDSVRNVVNDLAGLRKGFIDNRNAGVKGMEETDKKFDSMSQTVARVATAMENATKTNLAMGNSAKGNAASHKDLGDQLRSTGKDIDSFIGKEQVALREARKILASQGFGQGMLDAGTGMFGGGAFPTPDLLPTGPMQRDFLEVSKIGTLALSHMIHFNKELTQSEKNAEKLQGQLDKSGHGTAKIVKATVDWDKMLQTVVNTMQVLGLSADSFFAKVIGGLTIAAKAGADFKNALPQFDKAGNKTKGGDAAGMAAAIGGGLTGIFENAKGGSVLGGVGKGALGGAAFAQQAGVKDPMAFAAITAGGALVGGLTAAFTTPKWKKAQEEAAAIFGFTISQDLAKGISDMSSSLKIGKQEAMLLNLPGIAKEGKKEMRELAGSTGDLMNAIKLGVIPAEEGMKALNEQWLLMREEAQAAGRVGDRVMLSTMKRAKELGQFTPEMQAAVNASLSQASSGATRFAEGLSKVADLSKVNGAAAASSFVAAFNAIMSEKGALVAVEEMGGKFTEMRNKLVEVGGADTAAIFGPIEGLIALSQGPMAGLVEAAGGLRDMLIGIADAGFLNQESFTAMQQTAASLFDQMIAGGADTHAAIQVLAPDIQAAVSAAEQMGVPLDANMQRLKETAEQNGITFKTDPMLRMVSVLEAIAVKLGAELPAAADAFGTAINNIPDEKTITFNIEQQGGLSLPAGDFSSDVHIPGMAAGGIVTGPTLAVVGEAGPEAVVPLPDLARLQQNNGITQQDMLSMLTAQQQMLTRSFRDSLIQAR